MVHAQCNSVFSRKCCLEDTWEHLMHSLCGDLVTLPENLPCCVHETWHHRKHARYCVDSVKPLPDDVMCCVHSAPQCFGNARHCGDNIKAFADDVTCFADNALQHFSNASICVEDEESCHNDLVCIVDNAWQYCMDNIRMFRNNLALCVNGQGAMHGPGIVDDMKAFPDDLRCCVGDALQRLAHPPTCLAAVGVFPDDLVRCLHGTHQNPPHAPRCMDGVKILPDVLTRCVHNVRRCLEHAAYCASITCCRKNSPHYKDHLPCHRGYAQHNKEEKCDVWTEIFKQYSDESLCSSKNTLPCPEVKQYFRKDHEGHAEVIQCCQSTEDCGGHIKVIQCFKMDTESHLKVTECYLEECEDRLKVTQYFKGDNKEHSKVNEPYAEDVEGQIKVTQCFQEDCYGYSKVIECYPEDIEGRSKVTKSSESDNESHLKEYFLQDGQGRPKVTQGQLKVRWSWCRELLAVLAVLTALSPGGGAGSEVAVMHYGHFGGLSLTCQRDELILMESEVLGYSTNRGCAPRPQCAVPYTLAKWYCRGKSTCGGMQVERRPLHKRTCGSEFTNCLRVEYQCVPMSRLTDVCGDALYEARDGYIRSPSFPEMYPPDRNCSCALSASSGGHVQLDTAFFLLKSSRPCGDWLRVRVDEEEESSRCGYLPEQKRFIGHHVTLTFVSDARDTEMGFWLRFSGTGGGPVKVRCGRYFNTDDTVTPTIKTARPTTTTIPTTTVISTPTPTTSPTTSTQPGHYTTTTTETEQGEDRLTTPVSPHTDTGTGVQGPSSGVSTQQTLTERSLEGGTTPELTTSTLKSTTAQHNAPRLLPHETVHDMRVTAPRDVVLTRHDVTETGDDVTESHTTTLRGPSTTITPTRKTEAATPGPVNDVIMISDVTRGVFKSQREFKEVTEPPAPSLVNVKVPRVTDISDRPASDHDASHSDASSSADHDSSARQDNSADHDGLAENSPSLHDNSADHEGSTDHESSPDHDSSAERDGSEARDGLVDHDGSAIHDSSRDHGRSEEQDGLTDSDHSAKHNGLSNQDSPGERDRSAEYIDSSDRDISTDDGSVGPDHPADHDRLTDHDRFTDHIGSAEHASSADHDNSADRAHSADQAYSADHDDSANLDRSAERDYAGLSDHDTSVDRIGSADQPVLANRDNSEDHGGSVDRDSLADHIGSLDHDSSADHIGSTDPHSSADHIGSADRESSEDHIGSADRDGLTDRDSSADRIGSADRDDTPQGLLVPLDEEEVLWTSPDYVDLDDDYDQLLPPLEMTAPPGGRPPDPTPAATYRPRNTLPMKHFVHSQPMGVELESTTLEATLENVDKLIKELDRNEETVTPSHTPQVFSDMVTTTTPVDKESSPPTVTQTTTSTDTPTLVENPKHDIQTSIPHTPPPHYNHPNTGAKQDTKQDTKPASVVFSQNEAGRKWGQLARAQWEVDSVDSVELNPALPSHSDTTESAPHDWRLDLSRANFPYHVTTDDHVTTDHVTSSELLHYMPSGGAFSEGRPSIATGEFHPAGDIISLVDEQPTTTTERTTTERTTTRAPEIVTLRGVLNQRERGLNVFGPPLGPLLFPTPHPALPEDTRALWEYEEMQSDVINASWVPRHVVVSGETSPPQVAVPVAVKHRATSKDLMWVLIVIAIVLWVVFVALLALLIYHRRRRLTCFRGEDVAHHESRSPYPKNMMHPPLSAPMTPATQYSNRKTNQAETGTQTGQSRLSSVLSWTSTNSLNAAANTPARRSTVSGVQSAYQGQASPWSLPREAQVHRAVPSITPATSNESTINCTASTQTQGTSNRRKTSSVQTDLSGSIKVKSHRTGHKSRRNAPLPPVPMEWVNGPNGLQPVQPIHYVHTILRNMPGGSLNRPPYAEAMTDMTKNDLNMDNISNWATRQMTFPSGGSLSSGGGDYCTVPPRPLRSKTSRVHGTHSYATSPSVEQQNRLKSKAVHIRDPYLPPPPPECLPQASPSASLKSRKSTQSDSLYSTVKPRRRPRAPSISSQMLDNSDYWQINSNSLKSTASSNTSYSNHASSKKLNTCPGGGQDVPTYANLSPTSSLQRDSNTARGRPPMFPPPPPPPLPPNPPPLTTRLSGRSMDTVRTLPVGCEDPGKTLSPLLARGKSAQDAKDETVERNMRRGDSEPAMDKEKLKGLVPKQAFFFNNQVQPELRRILSKRRFGSEPVQV